MRETTKYRQLQPEDRLTIANMGQQGYGVRSIASARCRSASTISPELGRNTLGGVAYGSEAAQEACQKRRQDVRPEGKGQIQGVLWDVVLTMLNWRWSPQQIAGTLHRMFPENPKLQISHETIYNAIYAQPRGELRRQLVACLRHRNSKRMPRSRGEDRRGQITDMVSIHVRPPEIESRIMPGHWEGDFIKGAGNKSAVGVLVERTSRLVLLAKMEDGTAASALAGFSAKLNAIVAPMRKSLTYDQGKELARHADLAQQTGVNIYFCDPHSPWQRGPCENTNGLLREYLPKGTDLSIYTQDELDAIADSLNNRPRATHAFRSPLEVFAETLANSPARSDTIH